MKKINRAILAIVVLSAFGLSAQAQDQAADVAPQKSNADAQASPSDQVLVPSEVKSAAPVAPVEQDTTPTTPVANAASDCLGCGQVAPMPQGCPACGLSPVQGCAAPCCSACMVRSCRVRRPCPTQYPIPASCGDCANSPVNAYPSAPAATPVCVTSCNPCNSSRSRGRKGWLFGKR